MSKRKKYFVLMLIFFILLFVTVNTWKQLLWYSFIFIWSFNFGMDFMK